MLACSPRSHEVTLRASADALSRASRRRRTALLGGASPLDVEWYPVLELRVVLTKRKKCYIMKESIRE